MSLNEAATLAKTAAHPSLVRAQLLAVWRANRHPAIADLIDATDLAEESISTRQAPPHAFERNAMARFWVSSELSLPIGWTKPLASLSSQAALEQLELVAEFADPRWTRLLLETIWLAPAHLMISDGVLAAMAAVLVRDVRALEPLRAFSSLRWPPKPAGAADIAGLYFRDIIAKLSSTQTEPFGGEEEVSCSWLQQHLGLEVACAKRSFRWPNTTDDALNELVLTSPLTREGLSTLGDRLLEHGDLRGRSLGRQHTGDPRERLHSLRAAERWAGRRRGVIERLELTDGVPTDLWLFGVSREQHDFGSWGPTRFLKTLRLRDWHDSLIPAVRSARSLQVSVGVPLEHLAQLASQLIEVDVRPDSFDSNDLEKLGHFAKLECLGATLESAQVAAAWSRAAWPKNVKRLRVTMPPELVVTCLVRMLSISIDHIEVNTLARPRQPNEELLPEHHHSIRRGPDGIEIETRLTAAEPRVLTDLVIPAIEACPHGIRWRVLYPHDLVLQPRMQERVPHVIWERQAPIAEQ